MSWFMPIYNHLPKLSLAESNSVAYFHWQIQSQILFEIQRFKNQIVWDFSDIRSFCCSVPVCISRSHIRIELRGPTLSLNPLDNNRI